MHAILAEFGLPYRYPKNVDDAAKKIDAGITPEVVAAREDMRSVTTFTIDPRDAKDFDDALSFRKLDNGRYEVGVHIADVTHYVHPDTILRPRGAAARHLGISGRQSGAYASRASLQRHLLPAPRRGTSSPSAASLRWTTRPKCMMPAYAAP